MAHIDSVDTNRPLIEQLEDMYWLPFNMAPVHHYDLGLWHLSLTGELEALMPWDNGSDYASYVTPIDNENSYPRFYGGEPLWDSESPYIWLDFHPIIASCRAEVGPDETWIVGCAFFKIRVVQVREPSKSGVFDLADSNQLKQFIFKKHKDVSDRLLELGYKDRFSAWNPDEIQEYKIKGRCWYELIDGNHGVGWCFNLYTPLSDKHLLHIAYEPSEFWPLYHTPSEKALQVSKSPLWDFLDNLELSKMEEGSEVITGTLRRENDSSEEDECGWGAWGSEGW
ncbi:hypothetical protein ACJJIF_04585 [Microbulbifer sp. SSSA002]|uniref:hypothetical protein n=1 Tax=Microbulbifer sp. SSSA002 TaxID=3243376 RepID=UPI0040397EA7